MSLTTLLHRYANYNLWANRRIGNWLQAQPAALLGQPLPSSFPTIARTVAHLHDTETFWMAIWQGTPSPTWVNYAGADEEVVPALLARSEALAQYVGTLDEQQLLELCTIDRPWFKGEKPRYEFIHHCINHGAYHRGQIITMGRTLGMTDPPNTDFHSAVVGVLHQQQTPVRRSFNYGGHGAGFRPAKKKFTTPPNLSHTFYVYTNREHKFFEICSRKGIEAKHSV